MRAIVTAEIRTKHVPNYSMELYRYIFDIRSHSFSWLFKADHMESILKEDVVV
jgi:hypothetical protein